MPEGVLVLGSLARSGVFQHPWKGGAFARMAFEAVRGVYPGTLYLDIGAEESQGEGIRPVLAESDEAVVEALSAVDILLHPSIADTAPLAVLEAMACEVPVVGFRVGGVPEAVDETCGALAMEGDGEGFAREVLRLAGDPASRRQLGRAGRERVKAHFDLETMAARYQSLYYQAIVGHTGGVMETGTLDERGVVVGALAELRELQGERLRLRAKVREQRDKLAVLRQTLRDVSVHAWTRVGMALRVFSRPLKDRLRKLGGSRNPPG